MPDKTLEQEQSDMRKRWAVSAYRLEHGLVKGSINTGEFTLGVANINYIELLRRIEEIHDGQRGSQGISEGMSSISSEAGKGTQAEGEGKCQEQVTM